MERPYERAVEIGKRYLLLLAVGMVGCEATPPAATTDAIGEIEVRDATETSDDIDIASESETETQADSDSSCEGAPTLGCPCDRKTDGPCCLEISVGLVCSVNTQEPGTSSWTMFYDGGCDPNWRRPGTELLGLCGSGDDRHGPPADLVCDGYPKEWCPCDPKAAIPCCTGPDDGLYCSGPHGASGPVWTGSDGADCGCSTDPVCVDYPPNETCDGGEGP